MCLCGINLPHNTVEDPEVGNPEYFQSGVFPVHSLLAKRSTLEQKHCTTTKQEDVVGRRQAEGLISQVSSQKLVRA